MKALVVNCTLKASPGKSNTEALVEVVADEVALARALEAKPIPAPPSE